MLSCKEVSELVSKSMEVPLPLPVRIKLYFHLFICKLCRRYKAQMAFLRKVLKKLVQEAQEGNLFSSASLSHEAKENISKKLENQT